MAEVADLPRGLRLQSPNGDLFMIEATDKRAIVKGVNLTFADRDNEVKLADISSCIQRVHLQRDCFCTLHLEFVDTGSNFTIWDLEIFQLRANAIWSSTWEFSPPRIDQPGLFVESAGSYELSLSCAFLQPTCALIVVSACSLLAPDQWSPKQDVFKVQTCALSCCVLALRANTLLSLRLLDTQTGPVVCPRALNLKLEKVHGVTAVNQRFELKTSKPQSDFPDLDNNDNNDSHNSDAWETASQISDVSLLEHF
jgi:hypothetical protein